MHKAEGCPGISLVAQIFILSVFARIVESRDAFSERDRSPVALLWMRRQPRCAVSRICDQICNPQGVAATGFGLSLAFGHFRRQIPLGLFPGFTDAPEMLVGANENLPVGNGD